MESKAANDALLAQLGQLKVDLQKALAGDSQVIHLFIVLPAYLIQANQLSVCKMLHLSIVAFPLS